MTEHGKLLTYRVIEPCPAMHPEDHVQCGREAGHDPARHWYTVWEPDTETGENWPSYPVYWASA